MEAVSESPVLLLNSDYTPIRVIEWRRAICMVLDQKVNIVSQYSDKVIRSAHQTFPWPSMIALKAYVKDFGDVRLSRRNIFLRDRYRCGYCGISPFESEHLVRLTVDHVIPRTRSEKGFICSTTRSPRIAINSWSNLVTACSRCNNRKGAKTLEDAGMMLLFQPKKPQRLQLLKNFWSFRPAPTEWKDFL